MTEEKAEKKHLKKCGMVSCTCYAEGKNDGIRLGREEAWREACKVHQKPLEAIKQAKLEALEAVEKIIKENKELGFTSKQIVLEALKKEKHANT